jgi:integrase
MTDMPRPRPSRLHKETNRHGKTVWYVRLDKGPRMRIRGDYGSPEFNAAYQIAVSVEMPQRPSGRRIADDTIEWLWMLYRQTTEWTNLSLATRRQRENIMRPILKASGSDPLRNVDGQAIKGGIDRRKTYQARHFLQTMRGMYKWAVAAGHVESDPTEGKVVSQARTEGFPVWTESELDKFEKRWPQETRERVMFDVYLYTGLRRGDAARLGPQHVHQTDDGPIFEIVTEKNGVTVVIPILPELAETLAAGPVGETTFISANDGKPLKKESLGNMFADACKAAGINKSAHGIRKAAATRAANNGATVSTMDAIFGWTDGKMAALYTRGADRRALAAQHMTKLSKSQRSIPAPSKSAGIQAKKHNDINGDFS